MTRLFYIIFILFLTASISIAGSADDKINCWLDTLPESISHVELKYYGGTVWATAVGYTTGNSYTYAFGKDSLGIAPNNQEHYSSVFSDSPDVSYDPPETTFGMEAEKDYSFWKKFRIENGLEIRTTERHLSFSDVQRLISELKEIWPSPIDDNFYTNLFGSAEITGSRIISLAQDPASYEDLKDLIRFEMAKNNHRERNYWFPDFLALYRFVKEVTPSMENDFEEFKLSLLPSQDL